LVEPRNSDAFTAKVKTLLSDRQKLAALAKAAYEDTQNWGWESATSYLRNVQYQKAINNFDLKKEEKIEKLLLISARFCYYVLSTVWAIQISYGKPWLPKALGGLGTESFFASKYSENHDLRNYLLLVIGFHLAGLLKAALDGTIIKMGTPLVLTILFGSCYLLNVM